MDASALAAGERALKQPVHEVTDLSSDDELGNGEGLEQISLADGTGDGIDMENDESEEDEWENESLFEQALEEIGDEYLRATSEPEICTHEEAIRYRQLLRTVGPEEFVKQTVESDSITAKKLITAFGLKPPSFLNGSPDESYYTLLAMALGRELRKRAKLSDYNTVEDAVCLLKRSKNIIILTGAGISTSLGIPDFRSTDTGLYAKLAHLGLNDPQEVFDIDLFREDPQIFYNIARDILPTTKRFSPTHAFIKLLEDKNKLLTNYTQNIDNLEGLAGISPGKIIQCHGSFATASCVKCKAQVPGEAIFPEIRAATIPRCKRCINLIQAAEGPPGMKRKRSQDSFSKKRARKTASTDNSDEDDDDDDPLSSAGVMKPDITFFGEALSDSFSDRLTKHDKDKVDLVIVIGTSLKVAPVSEVVPYLPAGIPQMYISRTPVNHVNFDIDLLGDCDVVVSELCRRAGWDLKHEMIPENQVVEVETVDGFPSRHIFSEDMVEE